MGYECEDVHHAMPRGLLLSLIDCICPYSFSFFDQRSFFYLFYSSPRSSQRLVVLSQRRNGQCFLSVSLFYCFLFLLSYTRIVSFFLSFLFNTRIYFRICYFGVRMARDWSATEQGKNGTCAVKMYKVLTPHTHSKSKPNNKHNIPQLQAMQS